MSVSSKNRDQRKDVMTTELFQLLNLWRCNVKKDSIKIDSLMDKLRKGDEGKSGGSFYSPIIKDIINLRQEKNHQLLNQFS